MISIVHIQDSEQWEASLADLLSRAPGYHRVVHGRDATDADVRSLLSELPEGKSPNDKYLFAVLEADELVGCVDVIRGYPAAYTAFIGLLLIVEAQQRKGIGYAAYRELEKEILIWEGMERVRLAVVEANMAAVPFWQSCGFRSTGETRTISLSGRVTTCTIFEKVLPRALPFAR